MRKANRKARAFASGVVAAFLALIMTLSTPLVSYAAESPTYREALLAEMKNSKINILIEHEGWFIEKEAILYGRQITGIKADGTYQLGPWEVLSRRTNVVAGEDKKFTVPGNYVAFAYSVDIKGGTDWPYSGVFWCNPDKRIHDVQISVGLFVRTVGVTIWVDGNRIFRDLNCPSHKQWKP